MDFSNEDVVYNKFYSYYIRLIESRKKFGRIKKRKDGLESHHIVPRSLGGSDDQENKVLLTFREHFIAHLLLTRFTRGIAKSKMCYAIWWFNLGKYNTSRKFEFIKRIHNEVPHIWEGRIHSSKTIEKMRNSAITRKERNPDYSENMSKALLNSEKMKLSYLKRRGKKFREYGPLSDEQKIKMSKSLKGKKHTEETKRKIGDAISKSGRIRDPEGNIHFFNKASDFCSLNRLNPSKISEVLKGTRPHHKGWTKVI